MKLTFSRIAILSFVVAPVVALATSVARADDGAGAADAAPTAEADGHDADSSAAGEHDANGHDAAEHDGGDAAKAGDGHDEPNTHPLKVDPDLAIVTAIIFAVLMLVLGKFAWKPIVAGLDKREKAIADQIEEAHRANEKANETLAEYQTKLAAATEEVHRLIAEAKRDATAQKDKIIAEAQEAAGRERQRALADIQAAKNGALEDIAQKHVDQAFALARRVVRDEIRPEDHDRLVRESIERFSGKN